MIVNAVRLKHKGGELWVTDAASITAHDRKERTLRVSGEPSTVELERIGAAYLAGKSDPQISLEATPIVGEVAGVDYTLADILEVDGEDQACVAIDRTLNTATGDWDVPTPTFSSLAQQARLDADRALSRIIDDQGGGAIEASLLPGSSPVVLGSVDKLETIRWSWYDGEASGSRTVLDDPSTWNEVVIDQVCRGAAITCTVDYDGATGWSEFELFKNGSEWNPLFTIVMDDTPPAIPWAQIIMYGYEFLFPGDILTWRCTLNGQHRQGVLSIDLVPAV